MPDPIDIHRQDGGLPNLGLGAIDPHLDYDGKSVERLSDPRFRVLVLWTMLGQYSAAAARDRGEQGNDFPTINDARHSQLMATWTRESRRVHPDVRTRRDFGSNEDRILELFGGGKHLAAYEELIDLRSNHPEFLHPDVRFDLMYYILANSEDLHENDYFRQMVYGDLLSETVPGGTGYCDDAERLRRYYALSEFDESFVGVVNEYVVDIKGDAPTFNRNYFDGEGEFADALDLVAERGYSELAGHLVGSGMLSFEEEARLVGTL